MYGYVSNKYCLNLEHFALLSEDYMLIFMILAQYSLGCE